MSSLRHLHLDRRPPRRLHPNFFPLLVYLAISGNELGDRLNWDSFHIRFHGRASQLRARDISCPASNACPHSVSSALPASSKVPTWPAKTWVMARRVYWQREVKEALEIKEGCAVAGKKLKMQGSEAEEDNHFGLLCNDDDDDDQCSSQHNNNNRMDLHLANLTFQKIALIEFKLGSINTDLIFPNNKLTGTDVGYPGGLWFDPLVWGSGSPEKIKELRT
ncbi:PREDICTED: chlorophyll [Prunus dulcis]|uniref:PREDICTED: chlorophyll n=1 Tax=Prunus dulcis TaxID=3755 RepID=A0A5E4FUA1_PRUDU|nr:PREDICTED: chlorophyll [Prunus dulcis]